MSGVDVDQLTDVFEQFTAPDVGGTAGGGVSRPALSDHDAAVRARFADIAADLGLRVRIDDMGNMYARRPGRDDSLAPVVIGSHLDTVTPGGRFDGIVGVVAALGAVRALGDVETRRPIEVVNWTGEEGARFSPAMVGSAVATGVIDIAEAHDAVDNHGVRLGDELERIGYLGERGARAADIHAALELHIEQGPVLEDNDTLLGVVAGIRPVRWYRVTVEGPGGHAGGPGPVDRRDAMVAAARMIVAITDHGIDVGDVTTTVGIVTAHPGSTNVLASRVAFTLDLRAGDDESLDTTGDEIRTRLDAIAAREGVSVDVVETFRVPAVEFDHGLRDMLADAATKRGHATMDVWGTIGHDSVNLAGVTRTAMLFTPTRDGRSHSEEEHTPWEAVVAATEVLADVLQRLADE